MDAVYRGDYRSGLRHGLGEAFLEEGSLIAGEF